MITVLSPTPLIAPVYNPIYLKVSSDQTYQEGFSFVFDLYLNGVFINRSRLLPRPGTTECIYSPARILESYVSYDLSQNTIGCVDSANCIDQYEIRVGEEYVYYWYYYDNAVDSFTPSGYTALYHPTNVHIFNSGDDILIQQTFGFTNPAYNGIHKVLSVPNNKTIVINVAHTSTPVNGGKVCFADKRKTINYLAGEKLNNNTLIYANGNWSSYGPDGCGVTAGLRVNNTLGLTIPDASCSTGIQLITNTAVLVPGTTYRVIFTISAINNPSNAPLSVGAYFGGTLSPFNSTLGTYTYDVVMGSADTNFGIYIDFDSADTSGYGSHSIELSYVSVYNVIDLVKAYDFNGVVSYEEYPLWTYSPYKLSFGALGMFLTKSPRILKTTLLDRGTLGILQVDNPQDNLPGITYTLHIDVTNLAGITTNYIIPISNLDNTTVTNKKYQHLGVYPWNINELSIINIGINIIDNTTKLYKIHINGIYLTNDLPVSEEFTFIIDTDCTKYQPVRFMFLNSLGSFDYYTATLLSRDNINISRETFTKTLDYGYQVGDRGKTILNIDAQETYLINTNWMTETTSNWLANEFFLSNEIYVLDNNTGDIIPIILDNNSVEVKKRVNDSLLNYQFNYSKAVTKNTKRG